MVVAAAVVIVPPIPKSSGCIDGAGGGGRRGGANSQLAEIKIAISVDKKTNSLLVMAPPQDIELIRQIVEELDKAGGDVEEGVQVVSLSGTNLNVGMIDSALKSMLGPKARTNTNASSNTGSSNSGGNNSGGGGGADADEARRRAEMFQQLRERFQGGQGGGAPTGGFRGAAAPVALALALVPEASAQVASAQAASRASVAVNAAVAVVAHNRADAEDDKAW